MTRFLLLFLLPGLCFFSFGHAQSPVKWAFTSHKINAGTYEVHLSAIVDKGWHIYSRTTPKGGPFATTITFTKSPLLTLKGKIREDGHLEQHQEPLFGVEVRQFSDSVDFVQLLNTRGSATITVSGTITFMVCNDRQCMPPATQPFSIVLK